MTVAGEEERQIPQFRIGGVRFMSIQVVALLSV